MTSAASPAALLALAAAVLWGAGDFSGGMGVKRAGGTLPVALRVVLLSHFTSFCLLAGAALLRHDPLPHGAPVAWSLATGLAGGLSVTTFYVALAEGAMGAAAAISGLLAAAIPALISFAIEGSPGPFAFTGFALAAAAIWLIAAGSSAATTSRRALWLAVASGAGFGVYFVCLRMSSRAGLLWPMSGSRLGSMSVCLVGLALSALLSRTRTRATREGVPPLSTSGQPPNPVPQFPPPGPRSGTADSPHTRSGTPAPEPEQLTPPDRPDRPKLNRTAVLWALSTAVFDTGGNLFFMAATRAGRLDIAAVLASLYPASTILLAAWVLHERPAAKQLLGMLIAAAAVALITL